MAQPSKIELPKNSKPLLNPAAKPLDMILFEGTWQKIYNFSQ